MNILPNAVRILRLPLLAALAAILFSCNQAPGFRVVVAGLQTVAQPQSQSVNLVLPLSVVKQGGFDQVVNLSVENSSSLPAGFTVSFDPAITDSSSRIRISIDPTVPADTYTLKIRGVSGALSSVTDLPIRVQAALYSASLSESTLSVEKGASTETSLSVQRRPGFSGSLLLALEREDGKDLPTGLKAVFEPSTLTGVSSSSKLNLIVGDVSIGDYKLRVKVTSNQDNSVQYVPLSLKVNPAPNPDFSLVAPTPSLTFSNLTPQTMKIDVVRTGGYNETVQLRLINQDGTGLPMGIIATFEPAGVPSSAQDSVLKITPGPGVRQQVYNLKVIGSALDRQKEVPISLDMRGLTPQFVVGLSSNEILVRQGGSNEIQPLVLSVSSLGGLSGSVDVQLRSSDGSALPSGISADAIATLNVTGSGTPVLTNLVIRASISAQVTLEGSLLRVEVRPQGNASAVPFTTELRVRVRSDRDPDMEIRVVPQDSKIYTDILENEFSFPYFVVRYGGFLDPINVRYGELSGDLQNPRLSVNPLRTSDNSVVVSFTPRRTSNQFVASQDYTIPITMTSGIGSSALSKSAAMKITVVDFNIGALASEINVAPGGTTGIVVTRSAGFPFNATLSLHGRRSASEPYTLITPGDTRFPEIADFYFGDPLVTTDDILPGETTPPPIQTLTIRIAAGAPERELDLRVVGTARRPAIVGQAPEGAPQSRPHNFLLRIRN